MDKDTNTNWKVYGIYLLITLLVMWAGVSNAQIVVTEFNAEWNASNKVEWVDKLSDCDITKEVDLQQKHKVVIVPTIIIFKDGEEIKRYQADLSFKMLATRKEIQNFINDQIMSDF